MIRQELEALREEERQLVETIRSEVTAKDPACQIAYLPVPMPESTVDYVLVAMEPSFGRWAGNDEKRAQEKVENGFRSFIYSWDDFVFLYSIRLFLSPSFYVTDVSKAAMKVNVAQKERKEIYPKWLDLLRREIDIVGEPGCVVLFVGRDVQEFLKDKPLPREAMREEPLLHYSGQAARYRKRTAGDHKPEYEDFRNGYERVLSGQMVLGFAEDYMKRHGIPETIRLETISRLTGNTGGLTESRMKLIFAYYRHFRELKGHREASM